MNKRNLILMEQVEHVESERRIITTLQHPNIVSIYGTFQDEEFLCSEGHQDPGLSSQQLLLLRGLGPVRDPGLVL